MNSLAWIGVIAWGLLITVFGLVQAAPGIEQAAELAPHDVIFLVGGGLVTCLMGIVGLAGFRGWIPGLQDASLRNEQKSRA